MSLDISPNAIIRTLSLSSINNNIPISRTISSSLFISLNNRKKFVFIFWGSFFLFLVGVTIIPNVTMMEDLIKKITLPSIPTLPAIPEIPTIPEIPPYSEIPNIYPNKLIEPNSNKN